ncbi:MAG: NAD(P)-dependent oxidoreductase [Cystobacterineae bacterium]|nr:NAD(P)-dependent oxidoreductase [Cystobacterineae bacterium]
MEKDLIAFIGLGKMGAAMAANILRAGYPLVVWNRSADKAASLLSLGAKWAASPAAAAAQADFVISSLADDDSVRAVVSGEGGLLSGMRPGTVHIGTSTLSPKFSDELEAMHKAAGCCYIAGPVVGRVSAAEAAELMTFVAGDPKRLKTIQPLVESYAPQMMVVGAQPSQALTAKLLVNFLGASAMDLIGQSMAWAERASVSPKLVALILNSFFAHPSTREYVEKIGQRDFDAVGFTVSGGLKDVKLMMKSAAEVQLRLSSAEALCAKLECSIANGWQDKDWSCFTETDRALPKTS